MSRKRTSVMWKIERKKVQEIVGASKSLAEILRHFELVASGMAYKTLKRRMDEDNIDYSHIPLGLDWNKGRTFNKTAIPLDQVMVKNSTYCRGSLKRRLLKDGILKNECSICGQGTEWRGKPLVLVLDHINGVNDDNRIENLRIVCPQCDSQLDTTTGRNRRKKRNCPTCGRVIGKKSSSCRKCRLADSFVRKVELADRPSKEELERMVGEFPMTTIGKQYGVSDNAIRKWCRGYGIELVRKNIELPDRFCSCGKNIGGHSKTGKCVECFRFSSRKVVQRPSKDELDNEIASMSVRSVGRKYGVAPGTIRTWCRVAGLV